MAKNQNRSNPTASPAKPSVPASAPKLARVDDEDAPRKVVAVTDPVTEADVKAHAAKGEKLYEVSLPKGYTAFFWAKSKHDAKEQYLTYFGIVSTDHKIKVEPASPDDVPDYSNAKKKGAEAGDDEDEE